MREEINETINEIWLAIEELREKLRELIGESD